MALTHRMLYRYPNIPLPVSLSSLELLNFDGCFALCSGAHSRTLHTNVDISTGLHQASTAAIGNLSIHSIVPDILQASSRRVTYRSDKPVQFVLNSPLYKIIVHSQVGSISCLFCGYCRSACEYAVLGHAVVCSCKMF